MITQKDRVLSVSTPFPDDFLLLESVEGRESISELFSFHIHLLHEENVGEDKTPTFVDPLKLLGQSVSIKIDPPYEPQRYVSGIVNHFSQLNRTNRFTHYKAQIVPRVWTLTQRRQSRIFQQQSVPDILKTVFKGFNVSFELSANYFQRDYCVQYRESDWDFASRLMEDDGIFYFFEHLADGDKLIITDSSIAHRPCPSKNTIEFALEVAEENHVGAIRTWQIDYKLQSGKYTMRDHNFELPTHNLQAERLTSFNVGDNKSLEIYDYPGEYAKRFTDINPGGGKSGELDHVFDDNKRVAQVRMGELDAGYKTIEGASDCCTLTAGHRFTLTEHPLKENNGEYVLTNVSHKARQSPGYETGETVDRAYKNEFECINYGASGVTFRPARVTAKPIVQGAQTAVVVGQSGEEIFTDKYGRVKVQFHWDREGAFDAASSCWIRVAQSWAGKNWGSVAIPRIGQEVVVEFLEGDPDRPIIVGNVYNPDQMPPYELPSNSHTMGFKSNSTKGGGGHNEIVIIDGKAGEMVRIHAQKDMRTKVLNNDRQHVVVDRRVRVDGKHDETIKGNMSTTVTEGSQTNAVVAGTQANVVNKDVLFKSESGQILIEASTQITLKVGKSTIFMNEDGLIEIVGKSIRLIASEQIISNAAAENVVNGSKVLINIPTD
ncbi:MAG: type VI secretion system tip protein VgrG [Pyrinomonadaceae bacterium]|nr:type VI secretion system tip protein VgrG [Pyrinomonadaceae bacterium]